MYLKTAGEKFTKIEAWEACVYIFTGGVLYGIGCKIAQIFNKYISIN